MAHANRFLAVYRVEARAASSEACQPAARSREPSLPFGTPIAMHGVPSSFLSPSQAECQTMNSRSTSNCHACGGHVIRIARYSSYRRVEAVDRLRCDGCGQVFEAPARVQPIDRTSNRQ